MPRPRRFWSVFHPVRRSYALCRTLAFVSLVVTCSAAIETTGLRCDWAENPVGVDSTPPRLSWQLASGGRGARQTAWQVQAASTRSALERGDADLWDSGRVDGDAQLAIPYGGQPLSTGKQVFWRVRAWDETARPSPWSAAGNWTMGVVRPTDWTARWITDRTLVALTRTHLGFSTPPVANENTTQWVTVDLGASYPIDSIVLDAVMHTVAERLGFPRWFKLEIAEDPRFAAAQTIVDHTKDGINIWLSRLKFTVPKTPARYLRLTATRLRMAREEDQPGLVGRLALRQLEVYAQGRNVAIGATVTASASLETPLWSAASLVDGKEIPGTDARPAETLLLRREFSVRADIRRALLFVTGLGAYTVAVNGCDIGSDELLKPGWSDTARTCFYDTRDITATLHKGPNAIGITLAGGMYNVPAVLGRYTKFVSAPRPLVALAQLRLEYADGTIETVLTDPTWKVAAGPTTFAHVYGGEDYDARREPKGWDRAGFDDAAWQNAVEAAPPNGTLKGISEAAPPIRATASLPPVARRLLSSATTVYDLGQNAAIMPRLRVHGIAGGTVKISPAELVKPDGSIDPTSAHPSNLDACWTYTLRGDKTETWSPRFFYHGARYLQVECAAPTGNPLPIVDSVEAVVVHSDSDEVGSFSCSNELFNRIATLVRWAQRSNLVSVLTDCPHRERLGWLEQYHLNGPSLRYNFDLTRLYAKGLGDMVDAQRPNGLVPSIAPEYVRFEEGFRDSPEWGSAIILAAWQQFVWSGDDAPLRRDYAAMRRYFDYLSTQAQGHILNFGLGDWYDLGPKPPGIAQLTPIALTATAIYYEDAFILQQVATRLGRPTDAASYGRTAAKIAAEFNARFFDPNTRSYATGSQTANAMPLVVGLVPHEDIAAVVDQLVVDIRRHDNALTAGDIGYRYLLRALASADRSDVIFAMNNQSDKPGYGYQLAHGATSLTEAWDAGRHSSQDHFMLGQIIEWFYGDLAGLAPDPAAPGFAGVIIRPNPIGNVFRAHANFRSVRGPIDVQWRRTPGRFVLSVTIPANCHARIELPVAKTATLFESGLPVAEAEGVVPAPAPTDRPTFEVASGNYTFEAVDALQPGSGS